MNKDQEQDFFNKMFNLRVNNNQAIEDNQYMKSIILINEKLYQLLTTQSRIFGDNSYTFNDENYSEIVNNILEKLTLSKLNFPQQEQKSLKTIKQVRNYINISLPDILTKIPEDRHLKQLVTKHLDDLETNIENLLAEPLLEVSEVAASVEPVSAALASAALASAVLASAAPAPEASAGLEAPSPAAEATAAEIEAANKRFLEMNLKEVIPI